MGAVPVVSRHNKGKGFWQQVETVTCDYAFGLPSVVSVWIGPADGSGGNRLATSWCPSVKWEDELRDHGIQ